MEMTEKITAYLADKNVGIHGFADLRCLPPECRDNFDYGIVIGLPYSREAIEDNKNGNMEKYYAEFTSINKTLPQLATEVAGLLIKNGYKALAKVQTIVVQNDDFRTVLPHKTVATLAGIGWIGKCAMLVTKKYGSAVRIIVVLTNAPLTCGTPIIESKCAKGCTVCMTVCPGHAPLGSLWSQDIDRDTFFNAHACHSAARARAKETLNIDETVCGLCIANCPFTKNAFGYK